MQLGFTRFCSFLCDCDSCTKDHHQPVNKWPKCEQFQPGQKNVKDKPLRHPNRTFLPLLHIKLGMMNNLVNSLDDRTAFQYLQQKFPQISKVKIKEGFFLDPQIMDLMKVNNYDALLKRSEKTAWEAFMWLLTVFLANIRQLTIGHFRFMWPCIINVGEERTNG